MKSSMHLGARFQKRVRLLLNAPGGDLYSGAALVDCLRSRESGIYTVVLGIAASVAYLLAITATGRSSAETGSKVKKSPE
jgi:ATP-dependent protease ClpP protease subunit